MTTYKELVATLKAELKADVLYWIDQKRHYGSSPDNSNLIRLRARHMAYGMLRGKTQAQIEPKRRDKISWINDSVDSQAKSLLATWKAEAAEDIAAFEARRAAKLELASNG